MPVILKDRMIGPKIIGLLVGYDDVGEYVNELTRYMTNHLLITPKKIALGFAAIVFLLFLANLTVIFLQHLLGFTFHTREIFHFNREGNIPSIYSSLAILCCAFLLYMISNLDSERSKKQRPYWRLLMFVFAFLAADELVSIHETLTDDTKALLGNSGGGGFLYFAWVVPYLLASAFVALVLIRFLIRLPRRTAVLFIIAGCLYIAGAVGFEMIGGRYIATYGDGGKLHLTYSLIVTAEELLEMMGVIVFIYALSEFYVRHRKAPFRLNLVIGEKDPIVKASNVVSTLTPELPLVDESLN